MWSILDGSRAAACRRWRTSAPDRHCAGPSPLPGDTESAAGRQRRGNDLFAAAVAYASWAAPVQQQSAGMYLELAPLVVLFIAGYARLGLYPSLGLGPVETLRRLSYVTAFGFLILAAFSFALKLPHLYSRVTFVLAFVLSLAFVPLGRLALFSIACRWRWWAEPVVIIGTGHRAARAIRSIRDAGQLGYRPAAVLTYDEAAPAGDELEGVPIVGGLQHASALAACGIRVAFLEVEQSADAANPRPAPTGFSACHSAARLRRPAHRGPAGAQPRQPRRHRVHEQPVAAGEPDDQAGARPRYRRCRVASFDAGDPDCCGAGPADRWGPRVLPPESTRAGGPADQGPENPHDAPPRG